MKIVKKIFALSLSSILGLSFCAGTAFASKVPGNSSKISVKNAVEKPRTCYKLRRSPGMDFYCGIGKLDAIRESSKSVPLSFEDEDLKDLEEEEPRSVDIISLILSLNSSSRFIR